MKLFLFKDYNKLDYDINSKIKYILNNYYNIYEYEIYKEKNGKPFLNISNLYISISHSYDCLIIGFSNCLIGIDIEKVRSCNTRLLDRIINDNEKDYTMDKNEYLIYLWTRKESYVKMTGEGIKGFFKNIPLDYDKNIVTRNILINNNKYYYSICLEEQEDINIVVL